VNTALLPGGSAPNPAATDAIGSPSGSAAVTLSDNSVPSVTSVVGSTVTTGARSTFAIRTAVGALPLCALDAVNVTTRLPESAYPGVQLNVPARNVAPAGSAPVV